MQTSHIDGNFGDGGASLQFGGYVRAGLPVLLLLITTVYLGSSLDPFAPVKSLFLRLFAAGGVLVWIHRCVKRGGARFTFTAAGAAFLVLIAWAAMSFIYASNKRAALDPWLNLVCGAAVFYMVIGVFCIFKTGHADNHELLSKLLA